MRFVRFLEEVSRLTDLTDFQIFLQPWFGMTTYWLWNKIEFYKYIFRVIRMYVSEKTYTVVRYKEVPR